MDLELQALLLGDPGVHARAAAALRGCEGGFGGRGTGAPSPATTAGPGPASTSGRRPGLGGRGRGGPGVAERSGWQQHTLSPVTGPAEL